MTQSPEELGRESEGPSWSRNIRWWSGAAGALVFALAYVAHWLGSAVQWGGAALVVGMWLVAIGYVYRDGANYDFGLGRRCFLAALVAVLGGVLVYGYFQVAFM
jgi:hypothetical protein